MARICIRIVLATPAATHCEITLAAIGAGEHEFHLLAREGEMTVYAIAPEEPLQRQASFFIEAIQKGSATVCGGERAWAVVQGLEAINESIRSGGSPVALRAHGSEAKGAVA